MKPTMKDIAKAAHVSEGTVSNVINNQKGVSAETAQRIMKIAEDMGYKRKKSSTAKPRYIRYIIFKKYGSVIMLTQFYSEIIEVVENICRANNYELLITNIICNNSKPEEVINSIDFENLAGIIIQATEMDEQDMALFKNVSVPVVVIDNYFENLKYDYVMINSSRGASLAANYLIQKGHREIGILQSSVDIANFELRISSFHKALNDAGIPEKKEYQYKLQPTLDGSYSDMIKIIENKNNKLPTAFFAVNDMIALGAVKALAESGISVPDEVSVVGFDSISFCDFSHPRLTTVKVYNKAIASTAIRRLIEKIEKDDGVRMKIEIDVDLIERESVADI